MRTLELPEIQNTLVYGEVIGRMRDALIAYSRGECDTPMPMHLEIGSAGGPQVGTPAYATAEVHMKSSYRRGGRYFALKIASTFPGNAARGMATGNGMMLLSSAETGEPVVFLADAGHLTDVRTAAVAAMAARELDRSDTSIGILGTGIQARLQVLMHAEVLPLKQVWIWGRSLERAQKCCRDLERLLPGLVISPAESPQNLARATRLIVTTTASRQPLLSAADLMPGTHVSAVGSDSPGKQELDPQILRDAALLLVDSQRQCEKLGELQYVPDQWGRAVELGSFCAASGVWDRAGVTVLDGVTVCDFTGLGVEDLYIAEYVYERAI
jgi:ornithine cyclodeaminase